MLSTIICEIPNGDAILEMLRRFAKLLNKYARLLNYEDAYNDLMVFFLESLLSDNMKKLIGKPDAVIVHYIAKTIKNEYIRLSKSVKTKWILYSDLGEKEQFVVESLLVYHQPEPLSWTIESDPLTSWEKNVLTMVFEYEMSIKEIAEFTGKSRQTINQVKLNALSKLQKLM